MWLNQSDLTNFIIYNPYSVIYTGQLNTTVLPRGPLGGVPYYSIVLLKET
jgi:hypothetical protein